MTDSAGWLKGFIILILTLFLATEEWFLQRVLAAAKPPSNAPVILTVTPEKDIFTSREGALVRFVFKAVRPVRLCFEKDPLTQFQLKVSRSGLGELPINPMVTKDQRELFYQKLKIFKLNPGDSIPYRVNLKRLPLAGGEKWTSGNYSVSGSFNLCDQNTFGELDSSGRETRIPINNTGRFMIME